jgi:hypothetical protein
VLGETLDQLIADQPVLERKLGVAESRLSHCKQWLDALSDDLILEKAEVKLNGTGSDVTALSQQIENAEDELAVLRAVPVPSGDIKQRVQAYVAALGRSSVSGIDEGLKLEVNWPTSNAVSLLAILQPEKMCDVILAAIERVANTPLAAVERPARMAELRRRIVQMQHQEYALDPNADVGVEVLLGVKVVRRVPAKQAVPARPAPLQTAKPASSIDKRLERLRSAQI